MTFPISQRQIRELLRDAAAKRGIKLPVTIRAMGQASKWPDLPEAP